MGGAGKLELLKQEKKGGQNEWMEKSFFRNGFIL